MRLPYLQVTQETWDYAKSLSVLLEIEPGRAFMMLCDLWRWGLGLGSEDVPPTGICANPRAAKLMAGAVGWTGDADELATVLKDIEVVEVLPEGLRVRGMDRYRRTWEKNRRKVKTGEVPASGANRAGKVPETGTNPAPPAPVPARQTQTQTQTQIKDSSSASQPQAAEPPVLKLTPSPAEKPAAKKAAAEKPPPDPRHAPTVRALCDAFEQIRGSTYGFEANAGHNAREVSLLLALAEPAEIERRWRRALAHVGFPSVAKFSELRTNWDHFAGTGPPTKAAKPLDHSRGMVRAQDVDRKDFEQEGILHGL